MWLLKRYKHWRTRRLHRTDPKVIELGEGPRPPLDLLDHIYRLPDETVKVIGYRYGSILIPVPYLLRSRVLQTSEIVLIPAEYIRRFGVDLSPKWIKKEATRRPYVPRHEEVLRIIGWSKADSRNKESAEVVHFVALDKTDQGEGVYDNE